MSAHMLAIGYADRTGVYLHSGDGYRPVVQALELTPDGEWPLITPLGRDVAALCDAILRGEVEPCPVCNRYDCDCDEWGEIMHTDPTDPDPHGDLRALQAMEIPL